MEIDSHYTNPKLTKLYDLDSGWSKDREFYLSLSDRKCEVLDLGCGTGLLDEAFAKRGHIVTAVDPSQEMLHIAQLKRAIRILIMLIHQLRNSELTKLMI